MTAGNLGLVVYVTKRTVYYTGTAWDREDRMSCERPTPATAFLPQLQTPSKPSWLAQTAEFRKELFGNQRLSDGNIPRIHTW